MQDSRRDEEEEKEENEYNDNSFARVPAEEASTREERRLYGLFSLSLCRSFARAAFIGSRLNSLTRLVCSRYPRSAGLS